MSEISFSISCTLETRLCTIRVGIDVVTTVKTRTSPSTSKEIPVPKIEKNHASRLELRDDLRIKNDR